MTSESISPRTPKGLLTTSPVVNIFAEEPLILPSKLFPSQEISNVNTSPSNKSTRSSVVSMYCRICHDDSSLEELIDPCQCSGTLALVHSRCLEKWLSTSGIEECEICKHPFYIRKMNKSICESIYKWLKSKKSGHEAAGTRGILGDALSLFLLTPLCITATYLCGMGAYSYSKFGFWEGTGLAMLCCMLIATYSLWLLVTVRYHYKSWREWRSKNQDIKLILKGRRTAQNDLEKSKNRRSSDDGSTDLVRPSIHRFGLVIPLLSYFTLTNDPLVILQQTSFV